MNSGNALGPALAGVLTAVAVVVPIALVAAVGTMPSSVDMSWISPRPTQKNSDQQLANADSIEANSEATAARQSVKSPEPPKVPEKATAVQLPPISQAGDEPAQAPSEPKPLDPKPEPANPAPVIDGPLFTEATPSEFPNAPGPESPHLLGEKPVVEAKPKPALQGFMLAMSNVMNAPLSETKRISLPELALSKSVSDTALSAPAWTSSFDYAQIWSGDPGKKMISITIDDGPHPTFTPKILATLRAEGVKATFFFIGRNVECCPDIARQAMEEGHDILNHTFNHIRLGDQPESVVRRELTEGMRAIEEATGYSPHVYRTPGGGYSTTVLRVANEMGLTMAQWSANAYDGTRENGSNPSGNDVYRAVMQQVKNGGIILMHEPSAGTLEALLRIIRDLKARGYQFVPLTTMLQQQRNQHTSFEAAMARGAFSPKDYILR